MNPKWIADRMGRIEASGIRKVFDLARSLPRPVNLSIGQPHFPVPQVLKDAAKKAIDDDRNAYSVTQGVAELLAVLRADIAARYPDADRPALVTSGTCGALMLALCSTINPGDEVIIFDPYFVAYPSLIQLAGGVPVVVDTYPDFQIDPDKFEKAITPKTKAVVFASPSNPTGVCLSEECLKGVARVAEKHGVLVISDEIYRMFNYDGPHRSVAEFLPDALVVEGLGKSYGVTGWRLGYAHGPRELVEEMTKLQQFTFVCAPAPFQYAAVEADKVDLTPHVDDYRRKRDRLIAELDPRFAPTRPGGAFYLFPRAPWGTGTEFVHKAITTEQLLVIPGGVFGLRDTHFRVSFAASDATISEGIEILNRLASSGG